jgi:hypothetical protein
MEERYQIMTGAIEVPVSDTDSVRQEYARAARIGLSPECCFDRAVRLWLDGHPDADRLTAERAVAAILGERHRGGASPARPLAAPAD